MTVKELKEILDACNDDAKVIIVTDSGDVEVKDENIYQEPDDDKVIIYL